MIKKTKITIWIVLIIALLILTLFFLNKKYQISADIIGERQRDSEVFCGNAVCDQGENSASCFEDCYSPGSNVQPVSFQSGDFEDGLGDWTDILQLDSQNAASGQYSGKFKMQEQQSKYLTNNITIGSGKKINLNLDLKYQDFQCQSEVGDKNCHLTIQIREFDINNNQTREPYGESSSFVWLYTYTSPEHKKFTSRDWTNFKYSFIAHPNTKSFKLFAISSAYTSGATIWLDNLSIFQSDKQISKQTVLLPGNPCANGMCVDSAKENGDTIDITTTGALFRVKKSEKKIELYQRIVDDQLVDPIFRGSAVFNFDFSSMKIEDNNNNVVILADNQHWLAFNSDSTIFFASRPALSVSLIGNIKPEYQLFFDCQNLSSGQQYLCSKENVIGGSLMVFDKKGSGGIGLTPATQKGESDYVDISSPQNFTQKFSNKNWSVKYDFIPNQAGIIHLFPPKKFDWNKYCQEKTWLSMVCQIDDNLNIQCPNEEVLREWKKYTSNVLWFGPWVYEKFKPEALVFQDILHRLGSKLILYASAQWPYSKGVSNLDNLFNQMKQDNIDGFYIDGMYYRNPYSPSPIEDWIWLRSVRQIAGSNPIILHHSRSYLLPGRRYAADDQSHNYFNYYPFVFAYADYGFVTESVSIKGLEIDSEYLKYFVSQYGISNIIQMPKTNCYNRANANFENLQSRCRGYSDSDRQYAFTNQQLIDKILSLNGSMMLRGEAGLKPVIDNGTIQDAEYLMSQIAKKCAVKTAYCGDKTCQSNETCLTCPQDCGKCPKDGDDEDSDDDEGGTGTETGDQDESRLPGQTTGRTLDSQTEESIKSEFAKTQDFYNKIVWVILISLIVISIIVFLVVKKRAAKKLEDQNMFY